MTFAPLEVAKYFGHEMPVPEIEDVDAPFLFHKWHGRNIQYKRFMNPLYRPIHLLKQIVKPVYFRIFGQR